MKSNFDIGVWIQNFFHIPAVFLFIPLILCIILCVLLFRYHKAIRQNRELAQANLFFSHLNNRQNAIEAHAHIGTWELNLESSIFWASEEAFSLCGVTVDSPYILFDDFINIFHPTYKQKALDIIEHLKKSNGIFDFEYQALRKKGQAARTVRISAATMYDKTGAPKKIMGILQDITEYKQTADALNESERSKAVLLHNLPGMAYRCLYDRDYTMTFVSEGCIPLTGYPPEALLFNKLISYNDLICTEYRGDIWALWQAAMEQKKVCQLEYPIVTATGDIKWVWEQGQGIFDTQGKVTAIEGYIQDITERRQKEQEALYLNYHDVLTGLFNRTFYDKQLKLLDTAKHLPLSVIVGDINGLKLINDAFGHFEGDKLLKEIARILLECARETDIVSRTGGDEFIILMPNTDNAKAQEVQRAITEACLAYANSLEKETYYTSIALGNATKASPEDSLAAVIKLAEQHMYKRKLLDQKSIMSSLISSIKMAMYEKSQVTEEHAERLAALSRNVGKALDLDDMQINELELLSTLHDIGKISVDGNILVKTEKLTKNDWDEIKRHPEVGYRIALSSPELKDIAEYILCHHENWDGSGYPQGLCGEAIPLLSRVISVIDAFDAMTQDRPYRKAMKVQTALEEIRRNAGSQFDPYIARVFIHTIEETQVVTNAN